MLFLYQKIKTRWINELIVIYETKKYCKNMRKKFLQVWRGERLLQYDKKLQNLPKVNYIKIKKKAAWKKS